MILKLLSWTRSFCSKISRKSMNMNKCYFRHIENEERIDITFMFTIKDKIRQFNFNRSAAENIDTLNTRIVAGIQKQISKAFKKKSGLDHSLDVQFFDNNNPITGESTCMELFSLQGPIHLKINEHELLVIFNSPWIVSLNLPESVQCGFPVYPEIVMLFANSNKTIYQWFKGSTMNENGNTISDIHIKWELVGNEFVYIPTAKDIGMKLKLECTPVNDKHTGPTVEVLSKKVIEAGPGFCPFENRHLFTTTKLSNKSFRCVTYNILADLYCDSDYTREVLHPYCPPYALDISYRKQLISKEIIGYNADIMCLQEVDKKIFVYTLEPILSTKDYKGSFYKKGKEVAEGLAVFYRRDRFTFIGDETILLSNALQTNQCMQSIWSALKDNVPLLERLLDKSTVASATILQSNDNPQEILIVGNTHLYFHPDADHIRLIQGGIVIYWLNDVRNNLKQKYPEKRVSLILCGDFNSTPSCGIYQLYTAGKAPSSLPDWKSNSEQAIHNLSLEQNVLLESACGTPQFTNFTSGFADCLDYIFYEKSALEVEQIVPLPSLEELQAHTALPSVVFPSDHIALVSDLRFK